MIGKALGDKFVPALVVVVVGLAFATGVLWQKVQNLEGGGKVVGTTDKTGGAQPTTAPAPNNPPANGKLSADQVDKLPKVTAEDHVRGNRNAKVKLVEYSDYQCPFCSRFHPTISQVLDEYSDDVAIVYRHFPLDSLHPKARSAAEASECAFEVGGNDGFWAFTDYVFENQQTALNDFSAIATSIGINVSAFDACVNGGGKSGDVDSDYQGGLAAGVTGTPGNFIVNDKGEAWALPGAVPFASLKSTIDEALGS